LDSEKYFIIKLFIFYNIEENPARVYTPINRKKEIIVIIAGKGAFLNINRNDILLLSITITP